jgi:predicted Rossmann fold flavoprotein
MSFYDVVVIGAGASGIMCALQAAKLGKQVIIIDHQAKPAQKLLISGGGHCNFTNLNISPANYLSQNSNFCISALKRFSSADCIKFFQDLGISYVERQFGQLFCQFSAKDLVARLLQELQKYKVALVLNCQVASLTKNENFQLATSRGIFASNKLVIATGGLSYPNLGASNFGYKIAEQFGMKVIAQSPALVPLTFNKYDTELFKTLAGVSLTVSVRLGKISFTDKLLFTHTGLSGPAILQISSYWQKGHEIELNLLPDVDLYIELKKLQQTRPKVLLKNVLAEMLPKRLAQLLSENWLIDQQLCQYSNEYLRKIVKQIQCWQLKPTGTLGYKIAEVTTGGIDTNEISSKTFEAKKVPGLHFIGEVLDVTGQLGGYNLHWAFASGFCCSQVV